MREKNRKPIASYIKLPQFTTMNVIDGQAGVIIYSSLICYSLTIDNILNIIVLLILAGVTVSTLTGDNGLFQKATTAREENEEAKELELIKLAVSAAQLAGEGTITTNNLNSELKTNFYNDIEAIETENGWNYRGYKIDKNGSTQKILPEGYKQIEYLESTGTQWIKTGITNNIVDFKFVFDCTFFVRTPNSAILGDGFEGTGGSFSCSGTGSGFAAINYGSNQFYTYNKRFDIDSKTHNEIIVAPNIQKWISNNNIIVSSDNEDEMEIKKPILIFRGYPPRTYAGTIGFGNPTRARIYNFKGYINSTERLIVDFIPCYSTKTIIDADGKECSAGTKGLYDLVEGKFYTNQGTGEFIAGPEV